MSKHVRPVLRRWLALVALGTVGLLIAAVPAGPVAADDAPAPAWQTVDDWFEVLTPSGQLLDQVALPDAYGCDANYDGGGFTAEYYNAYLGQWDSRWRNWDGNYCSWWLSPFPFDVEQVISRECLSAVAPYPFTSSRPMNDCLQRSVSFPDYYEAEYPEGVPVRFTAFPEGLDTSGVRYQSPRWTILNAPPCEEGPDSLVCTTKIQPLNADGSNKFHVQLQYTWASVYDWAGFDGPVADPDTLNVARAGRTIPVKFALTSSVTGAPVSDPAVVRSVSHRSIACDGLSSTDLNPVTTSTSTNGQGVTYDADTGMFQFNWKTPSDAGCYALDITLESGQSHSARFLLR